MNETFVSRVPIFGGGPQLEVSAQPQTLQYIADWYKDKEEFLTDYGYYAGPLEPPSRATAHA